MSDLSNAEVGSKIKIPAEYSSGFSVATVTKVSDAQIACGSIKLRKYDGLVIGSGATWRRRYASVATDNDFLQNRIKLAQIRLKTVTVTAENLSIAESLIKESN